MASHIDRFHFRAWDKEKNCWATSNTDQGIFHLVGEVTMFDLLNQYQIKYYDNLIIMQSTGLADKVGNEIFENDIVRINESNAVIDTGVIEWSGEYCVRIYRYRHTPELRHFVHAWAWAMTVIGNRYENPELLKEV